MKGLASALTVGCSQATVESFRQSSGAIITSRSRARASRLIWLANRAILFALHGLPDYNIERKRRDPHMGGLHENLPDVVEASKMELGGWLEFLLLDGALVF